MIRWEYFIVDLYPTRNARQRTDVLNRYGAQGWELVSVTIDPTGHLAYFKRLRDDEPEPMRPQPEMAHAG